AEQLDTRAKHSSRSARDLLSHIVGSELTFVLRTKGRQNEGESRHVDTWPGFEVLREVAASSGEDLIAIAAELGEDEIKVTLALIGIETPTWTAGSMPQQPDMVVRSRITPILAAKSCARAAERRSAAASLRTTPRPRGGAGRRRASRRGAVPTATG